MSTIAFKSNDEERPEHRYGQNRRYVELTDRVGRVLAYSLEIEDRLGEDRSASHHRAEVEAPERDDG